MATVALDVFLPQLATKVVGCPEPVIKDALVTAATDFCTRSLCWHERLPAVAVTSTSFPYSIPTAVHAALARVMYASVAGSQLYGTSYAALDRIPGWDSQLGGPTHYLVNPSSKLVVYPLPAVSSSLVVRAAYTVARGATVLEDVLFDRWRDEIVHGALAILHDMPGRAWTEANEQAKHARKFEQGISRARIEALQNMSMFDATVSPRPLA